MTVKWVLLCRALNRRLWFSTTMALYKFTYLLNSVSHWHLQQWCNFICFSGFVQILENPGISVSHFPGLEITRFWKVVEMWIAGVTNLSMVSEWLLDSEELWSHPVFSCTFVTSVVADDWHLQHNCICYNRYVTTLDAKWHNNLYIVPQK